MTTPPNCVYTWSPSSKIAKNDILDAVAACASDQAYHPVRDYLNGLTWDGVPRLDTLFIDYLGRRTPPTPGP